MKTKINKYLFTFLIQDQDGFVTFEEMRAWIQFTQQRYIREDVERQWAQHMEDPSLADHENTNLDWEQYRKIIYGFLDDEHPEEGEDAKAFMEEQQSYK